MAHFVSHSPPEWEFIRRESIKHKKFRECAEKQLAEINKNRNRTDSLWWTDQRYVDREAPFHLINPNYLDPFNYRYQVYACPSVQKEPVSLSEVTDKVPISYNVKQIAVDKAWNPGKMVCSHHWSKNPWQLNCCPPITSNKVDTSYNKNNNTRSIRSTSSIGQFDDTCQFKLSNEIPVSNRNTDVQCANVGLHKQHNSYEQGYPPSDAGRDDSRDFYCANIGQSAFAEECSPKGVAVYNNNCSRTKRMNNGSVCDGSDIISPNNRLGQTSLSAYDLINNKKENNHRTESSLIFASARATARCNKTRASTDTIASLLGNQNNNRNAAGTRDSHEIIRVDNLVFSNMNAKTQYPKIAESHLFKLSQCKNSNILLHGQDEFMTISVHCLKEHYLCRNNNAECEYDSSDRPRCVPGHYRDYFCLSEKPYQAGVPPKVKDNTYSNRSTSCMELLGHLQDHTRPRCFVGEPEKLEDIRTNEVYAWEQVNIEEPNPGYMTYKIIGGKQYRLPPPKDYVSKVRLPPHLEEYREFTRRCPNPAVGRYDRTDPTNEMLLPGHRTMNLMKAGRSPFMYTRNPKCHDFPPLFHEPRDIGNLYWKLPSTLLKLHCARAKQ